MRISELPWLLPVPPDFRRQVRALASAADWESDVRRLASTAMGLPQFHVLSRTIASHTQHVLSTRLKMSVLSNATTDLIADALVATAPRYDVWLDVAKTAFGNCSQEALDPQSDTNRRRDDFVLLAIDHRGLKLTPCLGDPVRAEHIVEAALSEAYGLAQSLISHSGATVLLQTLPRPPDTLFGSIDAHVPGTRHWMIARYNQKIRECMPAGTLLIDTAALAETVGLEQWHDAAQWHTAKFSFSPRHIGIYSDWVIRTIAAARGKSKKCLVLDLDNTLWGGVIGDDGLNGIVLGQGSPVGEAYLAVQEAALALRERGVVLAVSSKNEKATALQVFREHPDMILREEHIAVFQANWADKASNLRAIASTLNIGVDALVFLDDNPAERQQVRMELPSVAVPELPASPELFAATLLSAGYFESISFTNDDRARAEQYQANAARTAALEGASDLESYLSSLCMEAFVAPFDALGRARITQLINKTNQFNLTTRRYSETEVESLESDPTAFTLQVRLRDRFGDNGMISVIICKRSGEDWLIDTWLMSCRVLKRRLEEQVLNVLVAGARRAGIAKLIGIYRPTAKNQMVSDHYLKLGFEFEANDDAASSWVLRVATYEHRCLPIKLTLDPNLPV